MQIAFCGHKMIYEWPEVIHPPASELTEWVLLLHDD